MHVVGSVIARLGSKRLAYKNILPFAGQPMLGIGIETLKRAATVDQVVVSTGSELIARVAHDFGVDVLRRPDELAGDDVASVPVFQHIVEHYPCDVHVNLNVNFPTCSEEVVNKAVEVALQYEESLSRPCAVWAQTYQRLMYYGDPFTITAEIFDDKRAGAIDVHTEEELLEVYRIRQGAIKEWE